MFSSQIDRARSPFRAGNPGVVLGTLVLIAASAALVSARVIPFLLAVVAASLFARAVLRGTNEVFRPTLGAVEVAAFTFAAWAALSAMWALDPALALERAGLLAVITFGALLAARICMEEPRMVALRLAEGLWLGLVLALVYFLIELGTGQAIKIWLYNLLDVGPDQVKTNWFKFVDGRIVSIKRADLTRNAAPLPLLLWPALMAVLGAVDGRWRRYVVIALVLMAAAVVALCPSESAKLALLLGAMTGAVALCSSRAAWLGLAGLWSAACLLVVPAALLAHDLDLHNARWLAHSAKHRIIIWNYTAEETLKSPFAGTGAASTYIVGQYIKPDVAEAPGEAQQRTLSQHAHSVYLQVWYELGLPGALLLLAFGLAVIRACRRLAPALQPAAAATFASAMCIAGSSYGLWQIWFLAMFGLAVIAFAIGARATTSRTENS